MNAKWQPTPDMPSPPVGFLQRVGYLFGPPLLGAFALGLIFLVEGQRAMYEVGGAGLASLLGAGTTVIFGKAALGDEIFNFSLTSWHLAYIVMFVNAVSAYWYAYNVDVLEKLWWIGPRMKQARRNAVSVLQERPWIRRWAVVGVGAFVVTPLPGSGALGGALMGRIMGVTRWATFVSVSIAGVIVSCAYALLANELKEVLDKMQEFVPPWARVTIAVIGVLFMIWLVSKIVKWFAKQEATETVSEPTPTDELITAGSEDAAS